MYFFLSNECVLIRFKCKKKYEKLYKIFLNKSTFAHIYQKLFITIDILIKVFSPFIV